MAYPSIFINGLGEKNVKPVYKSKFDGGYQQQRPQHTRKIKMFDITHTNLTDAQVTTLDDFFDINQGLSFDFTHPKTAVVYVVTFDMDELDFQHTKGGLHQNTKIKLREV